MHSKCTNKEPAYASWAMFHIKYPDRLFVIRHTSKQTCSDMINMITKLDMNGQFKEVKLNGKNRLIYYLDETVNIYEL